MADKIVVLDRGAVAQVGSPLELYNKPNGLFVARFIGSPTMNFVRRRVRPPSAARRRSAYRPEHLDLSNDRGRMAGAGAPRRASRLGHVHLRRGRRARAHDGAGRRRGAVCSRATRSISRRAKIASTSSTRTAAGSIERSARADPVATQIRNIDLDIELMSVKLSAAALAQPAAEHRRSQLPARRSQRGHRSFRRRQFSSRPSGRLSRRSLQRRARPRLGAHRRGRARHGRARAREARARRIG